MKTVKIGVIGVGNISRSHLDGYMNDPRAEIYAFCDIDPTRLELMGKEYGITKLYTDIDEMLALPELEAVSVCTWNNAHAECAIKAMKAGKHVLCEKPMALNTELAEEMKRVSEETGKLLMIGFVRRFGDDCSLLKEYNDAGFFGDLYYIKVRNLRRNGNPGGWFGNKALSGGGPLIDLGVHVIDMMCYVMGNDVKPVSVFGATFQKLLNRPDVLDMPPYISQSAKPDDVCNVEDLATAMVRFDNGAVMSIEVAFCLNLPENESGISMYGTKAGATLKPGLIL
ncbi:MAG: Gfo/Idh/MocA family oxidoreductase, partial [Clostridia bacterium]|nr:Gfo/Idh/MocA family oxidoreductase [Clostridia bacterium]